MAYVGIKDVFIAQVTKNDSTGYTAGTPVRLGKTASLKKEYKGSMDKLYYDDALDSMLQGDTEKTLEIEVKELSVAVETMLQGQKLVKGMRIESTSDGMGDFAVGYRTKLLNGKYEFVWKYVCTPEPIGSQHDTVADKGKVNNRTVKFTCRNREIDGEDGININESELKDTDTDAKALLTIDATTKLIKWFTAVPEPLA